MHVTIGGGKPGRAEPPAVSEIDALTEEPKNSGVHDQNGGLGFAGFFGVLLIAGLLRAVEAARKSLWLDELHTLFVARAESLHETIARVLPDFHAPLYFVAVHFAGTSHPHAVRVLSIVASIATMLVLDRIAAAAGFSGRARAISLLAFACLPYQIQYGAELRPYAWMQLAAVVAAYAALKPGMPPRRAFLMLLAALTIGLYVHYLTAIVILAIGAVRLCHRPAESRSFIAVLGAGTLAVVLFLPWVAYDESWLFTNPRVMIEDEKAAAAAATEPASAPVAAPRPPTPYGLVVKEVLSAAPRIFAPMGRSLGNLSGSIALGGAAILGLVILGGLVLASKRRRTAESPELSFPALVSVALIALAVITALSVLFWRRIAVQYLIIGAWIVPLAVGRAFDRLRARRPDQRLLAIVIVLAVGAAGIAHVVGRPREDIRRAVEAAGRLGRKEGARYTSILRQPPHYSHVEPWRAYAPDLPFFDPKDAPPVQAADGRTPIYVVVRGFRWIADDAPEEIWSTLAAGRRIEVVERFDEQIVLYRLTPR